MTETYNDALMRHIREQDAVINQQSQTISDLLEALKNLVAKYDAMSNGSIYEQLTNGDFFAARKAIAKAKGTDNVRV